MDGTENGFDMAFYVHGAVCQKDEFMRQEIIYQQERENRFEYIPHTYTSDHISFVPVLDMCNCIFDEFIVPLGTLCPGLFLMFYANIIYGDINTVCRG